MKYHQLTIRLIYTISFILTSLVSMQICTQASVKASPKSLQSLDKGFNLQNHSNQQKKKKTRPKPPNTGTPNGNLRVTVTTR